jgi:hypothetical protein
MIINGYATLAEFRNYITPPNQTIHEDSDDDAVIESLIEIASRRVDNLVGRQFYPRIETTNFDIPPDNVLWLDDDLLEVLSFLNGDAVAIANTEYILKPSNAYPKYCLQMRDVSQTIFVGDADQSYEQVLDINAVWGYHEQYATRAWKASGTISVAMADLTTLTISMTAGHSLEARGGQIIKIGTELFNSSGVVGNVLTVLSRGDNGSTAATHLILAPVYVWQPMEEIKALTLEITKIMYRARYGENVETTSTYTSSGVIVTPRALPVWAQEVIRRYQRLV